MRRVPGVFAPASGDGVSTWELPRGDLFTSLSTDGNFVGQGPRGGSFEAMIGGAERGWD